MPKDGTSVATASIRRQLHLLDALARERLMEVHFRYAMELVDYARADVEASRALSIYVRLHHLRGADADQLYQKVFVALGKRTTSKSFRPDVAAEVAPPDTPQSLLGQIRRRLRGRANTELRRWVEFHTGRAETELLWTDVENARQFAELLEPVQGIGEAVAMYAANLAIPPARAEIIYYLVLAHSAAGTAPGAFDESSRASWGPAFSEPTLRSLRISTNRRESARPGAGG